MGKLRQTLDVALLLGAAVVVLLFLNGTAGVAIVGLLLLGLLARWEHLLCIHLLLSPLIPGYIQLRLEHQWQSGMRAILPTDVLFALLLIRGGFHYLRLRTGTAPQPRFLGWMLAWSVVVLAAALRGILNWPDTAFEAIRNYSVFFLVLPAISAMREERTLHFVLSVLTISSIVLLPVAVAASMYMYSRGDWIIGQGLSRPEKYISGSAFLYAFVASMYHLRTGALRLRKRWAYLGLACATLGIMLSYTRSLWLAAVASAVLIAWTTRRERTRTTQLIGLSVAAAATVAIIQWVSLRQDVSLTSRFTGSSMVSEEHIRVAEYEMVPDLVFSSVPTAIFGRGLGATIRYGFLDEPVPYVHNNVLNVLNTTGLLGATLFMGMIGTVMAAALRVRRHRALQPTSKMLANVVLVLAASYLLQSMFAGQLTSARTTPALVVLIAALYWPARFPGGLRTMERGSTASMRGRAVTSPSSPS